MLKPMKAISNQLLAHFEKKLSSLDRIEIFFIDTGDEYLGTKIFTKIFSWYEFIFCSAL